MSRTWTTIFAIAVAFSTNRTAIAQTAALTSPGISPAIRATANELLARSRQSHVEHQRLLLEDGSPHPDIASGTGTAVHPTPAQDVLLRNPSRAVVAVHTHPVNVPLSPS